MATQWVTIRNPASGGTARVPRSALPQMPKWIEVKSSKKTARKRSEPSASTTSGDEPDNSTGDAEPPADGEE